MRNSKPLKQYVALARVSSREQEREGFSLEVQENALRRYADQNQGSVVRLFRVAETASKKDERKAFRELIAFVKQHADTLDGVLFYKVDRAARNLFDYVELERLEADFDVPVIYVSQPVEATPAGRMMRRTLANMAAFYTEQQSLDVRDGHKRRVENGLFVNKAPYGYVNLRRDGRGLIEIHPLHGPKIQRIFRLYAHHDHTLDSLGEQLEQEGVVYTDATRRFVRSKLYAILIDRSYLGEVKYQGQWHPGTHPPLVDRATFDRVHGLLGQQVYRAHEMLYASELITCEFCHHPVTGEKKTKATLNGPKEYVYYRCGKYSAPGHPRERVTEAALDQQVVAMFDRIRIREEKVRNWFLTVLRARARQNRQQVADQHTELDRQLMSLRAQQDRLLSLRLVNEIDEQTFAAKNTEFRDRIAHLTLQIEGAQRGTGDSSRIAEETFELSQTLHDRWFKADSRGKRRLLEIVCLNFSLSGVTLVPTMRKPFSVLAEGLSVPYIRGDRI